MYFLSWPDTVSRAGAFAVMSRAFKYHGEILNMISNLKEVGNQTLYVAFGRQDQHRSNRHEPEKEIGAVRTEEPLRRREGRQ